MKHRTRVGVHARNAVRFLEADYELIRRAKIETLKTMSLTEPAVYARLRQQSPGLEFIVRLYDDRLHQGSRPAPADFAARMVPILNALKPYTAKFEIHNEPNHVHGVEGWGASDAEARSFVSWYTAVLRALKAACPWAKLGFPGLAPGSAHRDLAWLGICRDAINASDFLGCHCYWQYGNMLSDEWGLRFKLYHSRFPAKPIEITEFGNSTPGLSGEEMAAQYVRYYQEINRYHYLGSSSAFIASSPDPAWAQFAWMQESGQMMPVVDAVGRMERKEVDVKLERYFSKTGKTVRGAFLEFLERYGTSLCGYPITEQFAEKGVASQYFQRVAMEEYQPGKIRLKMIGSEVVAARPKIADLQKQVDKLSQEPVPACVAAAEGLAEQLDLLAAQLKGLQAELAKPGAVADDKLKGGADALKAQLAAVEAARADLDARTEAALKAIQGDQAAQIALLEAQVKALRQENEALKKGTQSPAPAPAPGPAPAPAPAPSPRGVAKPTMLDMMSSLPKHRTKQYAKRSLSAIKRIVVHHSATPADTSIQRIAEYHVKQWDWPAIGYHYVVTGDKAIVQTNPLEAVSTHTANHNTESVGICFMGSFMGCLPPAEQIQAGARLIAWLLQELKLEVDAVDGHRELVATACPGDQWLDGKSWKQMLVREIEQVLSQG